MTVLSRTGSVRKTLASWSSMVLIYFLKKLVTVLTSALSSIISSAVNMLMSSEAWALQIIWEHML